MSRDEKPQPKPQSKPAPKAAPKPAAKPAKAAPKAKAAPAPAPIAVPAPAPAPAPAAAAAPETKPKARRPRAAKPAAAAPEAGAAERPNSATRRALLAFLSDWRHHQDGEITAGGSLVVHYDPARFPHEDPASVGSASCDIIGYVRFLPGGELRHAALATLGDGNSPLPDDGSTSVAAEIPVPPETEAVELWFQRTDAAGATEWDSRFGENYRFGVVREQVV
jgi:hypothetical protein